MRIVTASIFVDDQEKALDFYTRVLGFADPSEHFSYPHRRSLDHHLNQVWKDVYEK